MKINLKKYFYIFVFSQLLFQTFAYGQGPQNLGESVFSNMGSFEDLDLILSVIEKKRTENGYSESNADIFVRSFPLSRILDIPRSGVHFNDFKNDYLDEIVNDFFTEFSLNYHDSPIQDTQYTEIQVQLLALVSQLLPNLPQELEAAAKTQNAIRIIAESGALKFGTRMAHYWLQLYLNYPTENEDDFDPNVKESYQQLAKNALDNLILTYLISSPYEILGLKLSFQLYHLGYSAHGIDAAELDAFHFFEEWVFSAEVNGNEDDVFYEARKTLRLFYSSGPEGISSNITSRVADIPAAFLVRLGIGDFQSRIHERRFDLIVSKTFEQPKGTGVRISWEHAEGQTVSISFYDISGFRTMWIEKQSTNNETKFFLIREVEDNQWNTETASGRNRLDELGIPPLLDEVEASIFEILDEADVKQLKTISAEAASIRFDPQKGLPYQRLHNFSQEFKSEFDQWKKINSAVRSLNAKEEVLEWGEPEISRVDSNESIKLLITIEFKYVMIDPLVSETYHNARITFNLSYDKSSGIFFWESANFQTDQY